MFLKKQQYPRGTAWDTIPSCAIPFWSRFIQTLCHQLGLLSPGSEIGGIIWSVFNRQERSLASRFSMEASDFSWGDAAGWPQRDALGSPPWAGGSPLLSNPAFGSRPAPGAARRRAGSAPGE